MRLKLLIPGLLWLAAPGWAENPMDGAAFEAYTRGKTLFFAEDGEPYGAEKYLPNRRVVWSFLDGECKDGVWYEDQGRICFVYEDRFEPQCWVFTESPRGLIARFEATDGQTELYEAEDIGEALLCPGPRVGV